MFVSVRNSLSGSNLFSSFMVHHGAGKAELADHIHDSLKQVVLSGLSDADSKVNWHQIQGKEKQIAEWLTLYGPKLASKARAYNQAVNTKDFSRLPAAPINLSFVRNSDSESYFVLGLKNAHFAEGAQKTVKESVVVFWNGKDLDPLNCKIQKLVRTCRKLSGAKADKDLKSTQYLAQSTRDLPGFVQAKTYVRTPKKPLLGCSSKPHGVKIYAVQDKLNPIMPTDFPSSDLLTCHKNLLKINDAISRLHDKNIIHRDIKPDNIMVNSDQEPVIIDLDLATPVGEHSGPVGTLEFVAPEVFVKGLGRTDGKPADIFALGVTFYIFMVNDKKFGHPIYNGLKLNDMGDAPLERVRKHLQMKRIQALSAKDDSVFTPSPRQSVEDLIVAMTHPLASGRPTARQVSEQLRLLIDQIKPAEKSHDETSKGLNAEDSVASDSVARRPSEMDEAQRADSDLSSISKYIIFKR